MIKRFRLHISFLLAILLLAGYGGADDAKPPSFQIVVHKENQTAELSRKELSRIFLKKTTTWKDGQKIQPVDLQEASDLREDFSTIVLRKKISRVKSYWQRKIFSGRGVPPPEKLSEAEVLRFVEENPGAIGYVSADAKVNPEILRRLDWKRD